MPKKKSPTKKASIAKPAPKAAKGKPAAKTAKVPGKGQKKPKI